MTLKIEWSANKQQRTETLQANAIQTALTDGNQKTGLQMIGSFPVQKNLVVLNPADAQNCKAIDHGLVRVFDQGGSQIGEYNLGHESPSGSAGFVPLPTGQGRHQESRQTA